MRFILYSIFAVFLFPLHARAGFVDHPLVKLQLLDKSTARTTTLEVKVGETVEYGSIFIKIQSCRKSEPLDKPESASFLQIWEVPLHSDKSEWIFSGWMFASSPALSAMDHPVYDVWVLDCLNEDRPNEAIQKIETKEKTANLETLGDSESGEAKTAESE